MKGKTDDTKTWKRRNYVTTIETDWRHEERPAVPRTETVRWHEPRTRRLEDMEPTVRRQQTITRRTIFEAKQCFQGHEMWLSIMSPIWSHSKVFGNISVTLLAVLNKKCCCTSFIEVLFMFWLAVIIFFAIISIMFNSFLANGIFPDDWSRLWLLLLYQWFPFGMLHPQVWYSPGNNIRASTVFAICQWFAQLSVSLWTKNVYRWYPSDLFEW